MSFIAHENFPSWAREALVFVLTRTQRTNPLASGIVFSTFPINQDPLGALSSTISTMSPSFTFLLFSSHFCLSCSRGKYSLDQRFQKMSEIYCTCHHLHFEYRSSFWNTPRGSAGLHPNTHTWLLYSMHFVVRHKHSASECHWTEIVCTKYSDAFLVFPWAGEDDSALVARGRPHHQMTW